MKRSMVALVVILSLVLVAWPADCQEGRDGVFGVRSSKADGNASDTATSAQAIPVPLEEISFTRVDQLPQTFDNKYFSITWVGDAEVKISVKKPYTVGFHLSSYAYPEGKRVKSNGEPWEVQTLLEDAPRLFKGGDTDTLKVKLPDPGKPSQIDLYTYRLNGSEWKEDVLKTPPHHGPTFGEDRKLHSARIINFSKGPDYAAVPGLEPGTLNPADFGYADERYRPIFDIVEKFCQANQKYAIGEGHTRNDGFAAVTDCSGFVGQFYQKLALLSGIPAAFGRDDWYPPSGNYRGFCEPVTTAFPPTDPRDLLKPGDICVMGDNVGTGGHIGVFMGYDAAGNPLIAHSTTRSGPFVCGNPGTTGVRIQTLPPGYKDRTPWGIFRLPHMEEMLQKISG